MSFRILIAFQGALLLSAPAPVTGPGFDHVAPALFELEPNGRYVSTDLKRWEVFTRRGVKLSQSVSVDFLEVSSALSLEGQGQTPSKLSMYFGNDRSNRGVERASFESVIYRGIYPGIDLIYRRREGRLKGDFIIKPGADPGLIRFRFSGAKVLVRDDELTVQAPTETMRETIPEVYDVASAGKVNARYRQYPDGSIGFSVLGHDPKRELVIDPDLSFSSFLGGSSLDQVSAMAYSPLEQVLLITGWTATGDLFGASAATFHGGIDGYYGRLTISTNGAAVLQSLTLFGGSGTDRPLAISVNITGTVAIGGSTTSSDFPRLAAVQPSFRGGMDGFIVTFPPYSSAMTSSTYLGGSGTDQINAVAIDLSSTVFFAGTTSSKDLPVTAGALQHTFAGGSTDGFVGSLTAAHVMNYLTYLGGSGADSISALAALNGEVYLTGSTDSLDYPVRNAFQSFSGGGQDAFVTKLTASAGILYSTFLGGNGGYSGSPEMGNAITVNSTGEVFITGITSSPNFPILNSAQAQTTFNFGITDAFLAKFTPAGGLAFSTYWGGTAWDQGNAIVLLPSGYIAVGGMTSSINFPTSYQIGSGPGIASYDGSVNRGQYDGWVSVFSPLGAPYWSTYLGGAGSDSVAAVATNATGEIFVGGGTDSSDFPIAVPLQSSLSSSGHHGFIAKIRLPKPQYGHLRSSYGQFILTKNADFILSVPVTKYVTLDWSNVCPIGTSNTEAIPVVGDWDNTGRQRLGLFRKSTGTWYLDINGDDLFTPGVDKVITNFGAGAYPVVGDWDNTGRTRLGFFSNGFWFLDINGDNVFSYADDLVKAFGVASDVPIVGDWTNTGRQRGGVFRGGLWYLDIRGDWSDQGITAIAGAATDNPVFADWDNTGVKRIGTYRTSGYPIGWWFVDLNGTFRLEGTPPDGYFIDGGTGDSAIVGIRSH